MGGLIPSIVSGLSQGYLQGEQNRMAHERQQQEDAAQERTRRLVIYKTIAENNPEAANLALTRDPLFKDFVGPVLASQQQQREARMPAVDALTAQTQQAIDSRIYQPSDVPAVNQAYANARRGLLGFGVALPSQPTAVRFTDPQAGDLEAKAQQAATNRADQAMASLPDAEVAQVFRPASSIKVGRAGAPIYDAKTGATIGYLPVSPEAQQAELAKIDRRAEAQKGLEGMKVAGRKEVEEVKGKNALERTKVSNEGRQAAAETAAGSRETVAGIQAGSRERVANINADSRMNVAKLVSDTRKHVAGLTGSGGAKPISQKDYTTTKVKITNDIAKVAHAIKLNQDPTISYASPQARAAELAEMQKAQQDLKQELGKWETAWQNQQATGGKSSTTSTGGKPQPKATQAPSQGGLLTRADLEALQKAYQAEQAKKGRR